MKYQTPTITQSPGRGVCTGQEAIGPARQKSSDIGPGPAIPRGAGAPSSKGAISPPKTPGSYGPTSK